MKTLAARQVGRNIIIMIDGIKFSKKTEDDKEVKSIKNKIELYNKKPSKTRLDEIKDFFTPLKVKEAAKKAVVKKGIKTSIKKEVKKSNSKKITKKIIEEIETGEELVKKVTEAHAAGTMTDEQIKDLQKLLAKEEEKRAEKKEEEKKTQEEQKNSSSFKRPNPEH